MICIFSKDLITGLIDLLIYFEVPEGKREEVKQKFNFTSKKQITLHQQRI
jgi:hypothetical protein